MSIISFQQADCIYGWRVRYRMFLGTALVRIRLNSVGVAEDVIESRKVEWRNGIRQKWSGRFSWETGQTAYFDVAWVESGEDYLVDVVANEGRSRMDRWDIFDTGDVASHEFGHMVGLKDEYDYALSSCLGRCPIGTRSVMEVPANPAMQRLTELIRSYQSNTITDGMKVKLKFQDFTPAMTRSVRLVRFEFLAGNSGQRYRSSSIIDLQENTRVTVSADELRSINPVFERIQSVPGDAVRETLSQLPLAKRGTMIVPGTPVTVITIFADGKPVSAVLPLIESDQPPEPGQSPSPFEQFSPMTQAGRELFKVAGN